MRSRANMNGFFVTMCTRVKNGRLKTVFMQPSNWHVKLSDMMKKLANADKI